MEIKKCSMESIRGGVYPVIRTDAPENSPGHQFVYLDGREYIPSMVEPFHADPNGEMVTVDGIRYTKDRQELMGHELGVMGKKLLKATALIDRLEGVLKDLEWVVVNYETMDHQWSCPSCERFMVPEEVHDTDCKLDLALAAVKEWRENR